MYFPKVGEIIEVINNDLFEGDQVDKGKIVYLIYKPEFTVKILVVYIMIYLKY